VTQTAAQRTAATVRAELARRQLSGRQVATDLDWSIPTMTRRLNGSVAFDVDELAQIAEYLGVPIATLIPDEALVSPRPGGA
jgi:transcriptional regulator with XRE-family HTH domain